MCFFSFTHPPHFALPLLLLSVSLPSINLFFLSLQVTLKGRCVLTERQMMVCEVPTSQRPVIVWGLFTNLAAAGSLSDELTATTL